MYLKNISIFILSISSTLLFSQKTLIIKDSVTKENLKDVRIIADQEIFYTNDDGQVLIPDNKTNLVISNPFYKEKKTNGNTSVIYLSPSVKDISEVNIKTIDLKKMINALLKDYQKIYFTKKSNYLINIRQKAYSKTEIFNLLIANLNMWTRNNVFDFGKKTYDSFLQLNLNNIIYYKTRTVDANYPFADIQPTPADFATKIFMNAELTSLQNDFGNKNANAKIVSENDGILEINFSFLSEKADYKGIILFNKEDKAIVYFEISGPEANENVKKNKFGISYKTITDNFKTTYEFYKEKNQYFPSKMSVVANGRNLYEGKVYPFDFKQDFIFNKRIKGSDSGLNKKIDLTKTLTGNIPTNEIKSSKTLLSTEEQSFVDKP